MSSTGHAQGIGTRRRGHSNRVWIILCATLDPISRRQERVEPLDKSWMSIEKSRNALDDSGRIDPAAKLARHGSHGGITLTLGS